MQVLSSSDGRSAHGGSGLARGRLLTDRNRRWQDDRYPDEGVRKRPDSSRTQVAPGTTSSWTAGEVHQMSHSQLPGKLLKSRPAAGKETAQQPAAAKHFEPGCPPGRREPQPIEYTSQIRRDRRLAVANDPACVIDQKKIGQSHAWRKPRVDMHRNACPRVLSRVQGCFPRVLLSAARVRLQGKKQCHSRGRRARSHSGTGSWRWRSSPCSKTAA